MALIYPLLNRVNRASVRHALVQPPVSRLWNRLLKDRVTILMLHRFHDDQERHDGDCIHTLAKTLEALRGDGYHLLSLRTAIDQILAGEPARHPTVVFTVDDGYRDFWEMGADVFGAFDCPVTMFLTTGFVDGDLWLWWDQVDWILASAHRQTVDWPLGGGGPIDLGPAGDRLDVAERLWSDCKSATDGEKRAAIAGLADQCGLQIPDAPPAEFAPLSWSEARTLEARGFEFGPHSVTHPILSRLDDDDAEAEIRDSWRRLEEELENPVPVFAYPNGQPTDFGDREIEILSAQGLRAAVTTEQAYAKRRRIREDGRNRFRVPRFDYPGETDATRQVTSGLETLIRHIR